MGRPGRNAAVAQSARERGAFGRRVPDWSRPAQGGCGGEEKGIEKESGDAGTKAASAKRGRDESRTWRCIDV